MVAKFNVEQRGLKVLIDDNKALWEEKRKECAFVTAAWWVRILGELEIGFATISGDACINV